MTTAPTTDSSSTGPPVQDTTTRTPGNGMLVLVDMPILLLVLFVGSLGFIGSFDGVNRAMQPYFHGLAWIVPAGIDASILAFSAADLRLTLRGLGVSGLRYTVWGLSAATVVLNVQTASNPMGRFAHAMMPILWIIAVEVGRKAFAKFYKLEHNTYTERIPWDMWLNFLPTLRMWFRRRMTRIKTIDDLVGREQARMLAVMRLRQQARTQKLLFPRWRWRKVATADELWAIKTYNLDPSGAMRRTAAAVSRGILGADLVTPTGVNAGVNPAVSTPAIAAATAPVPTREPAAARTPPAVKAPVNGSVNGVNAPAEIPPGCPESVSPTTWANLWSNAEALTAWGAYVEHRTETDETPEVRHLRERTTITRDRTTVSKWLPNFHARWNAEHGVNEDTHTPVHDSPPEEPERESAPVNDTIGLIVPAVNDTEELVVNTDRTLADVAV